MSVQSVSTVCNLLANTFIRIEQDIEAKKNRIQILEGRLEKLLSKPNPDAAQIAEIRADIQEMKAELEVDESQLKAAIEDYRVECGPWPPN